MPPARFLISLFPRLHTAAGEFFARLGPQKRPE